VTPTGARRFIRYITYMGSQTQTFKCIVTALFISAVSGGPAVASTLDDLFARLAEAEAGKGGRIERQIAAIWENSGSPWSVAERLAPNTGFGATAFRGYARLGRDFREFGTPRRGVRSLPEGC